MPSADDQQRLARDVLDTLALAEALNRHDVDGMAALAPTTADELRRRHDVAVRLIGQLAWYEIGADLLQDVRENAIGLLAST